MPPPLPRSPPPGAHPPGSRCFPRPPFRAPHWFFRGAGGLAPPLPPSLSPGSYRLTIYAWSWADRVTALDTQLTMTRAGWQPIGRFPTELFHVPGYYTQSELLRPEPTAPARWAPG